MHKFNNTALFYTICNISPLILYCLNGLYILKQIGLLNAVKWKGLCQNIPRQGPDSCVCESQCVS